MILAIIDEKYAGSIWPMAEKLPKASAGQIMLDTAELDLKVPHMSRIWSQVAS